MGRDFKVSVPKIFFQKKVFFPKVLSRKSFLFQLSFVFFLNSFLKLSFQKQILFK